MNPRQLRFQLAAAAALACAGCAAGVELQRGKTLLHEMFDSSSFYLDVADGSKSKPDNVDGNANLLWTDDHKRAAVVAKHIELLRSELEHNGFRFVEVADASSVRAKLTLKSVRFDPVGGWITDDAQLTYEETKTGALLGRVVAKEKWITPTVDDVFGKLIQGSLDLWGRTSSR